MMRVVIRTLIMRSHHESWQVRSTWELWRVVMRVIKSGRHHSSCLIIVISSQLGSLARPGRPCRARFPKLNPTLRRPALREGGTVTGTRTAGDARSGHWQPATANYSPIQAVQLTRKVTVTQAGTLESGSSDCPPRRRNFLSNYYALKSLKLT